MFGITIRGTDTVMAPVPIPKAIDPISVASRVLVPAVNAAVVEIPASFTSEVANDVHRLALSPVNVNRVPPEPAAVQALATVILNASKAAAEAATLAPAEIDTRLIIANLDAAVT